MMNFIADSISASEIVSAIDEFVGDDHVYKLSENEQILIQNLQDECAFYVEDEILRCQFPEYIDEKDLKVIISKFLDSTNNS